MQDTEQTELIISAQQGSPEAVGELYEAHYQSVYRYLYYRTGDPYLAEDLTGEVFIRMVESLSRFQGGARALRAWLFQIARNLSIDHYRRTHSHSNVSMSEGIAAPLEAPDEIAERRLYWQKLLRALKGLTADQRDVLILRFVSGMALSEVADTLHRSEDAIKGLQRRGLLALREILG
jgi:RNA polymerase sigma-70 factor (ECF subfamily)